MYTTPGGAGAYACRPGAQPVYQTATWKPLAAFGSRIRALPALGAVRAGEFTRHQLATAARAKDFNTPSTRPGIRQSLMRHRAAQASQQLTTGHTELPDAADAHLQYTKLQYHYFVSQVKQATLGAPTALTQEPVEQQELTDWYTNSLFLPQAPVARNNVSAAEVVEQGQTESARNSTPMEDPIAPVSVLVETPHAPAPIPLPAVKLQLQRGTMGEGEQEAGLWEQQAPQKEVVGSSSTAAEAVQAAEAAQEASSSGSSRWDGWLSRSSAASNNTGAIMSSIINTSQSSQDDAPSSAASSSSSTLYEQENEQEEEEVAVGGLASNVVNFEPMVNIQVPLGQLREEADSAEDVIGDWAPESYDSDDDDFGGGGSYSSAYAATAVSTSAAVAVAPAPAPAAAQTAAAKAGASAAAAAKQVVTAIKAAVVAPAPPPPRQVVAQPQVQQQPQQVTLRSPTPLDPSKGTTCTFYYTYKHATAGDAIFVTGSAPSLGAWDMAAALPLSYLGSNTWAAHALLPADGEVTYKAFVKGADGGLRWELNGKASNRSMKVFRGRQHRHLKFGEPYINNPVEW